MLQTEFPFELPLGYVDADGNRHRSGRMRLATAFDEIAPLKDPRVQSNPGYLLVILLSRVVVELGTLEHINPKTIEGLYAGDLAFLQDMYQRVNEHGQDRIRAQCPHCDKPFELELSHAGGSGATP
jgi:hypothetical protein